jgi:hypothetical protein
MKKAPIILFASVCIFFTVIFLVPLNQKLKYAKTIRNPGSLESKSSMFLVEISTTGGKLHYKIKEKLTEKMVFERTSGNTFHRWFIAWDEKDRLWVWSSDIGGEIIFRDKENVWQHKGLHERLFDIRESVQEFQDQLPSSIKEDMYLTTSPTP